MSRSRLDPALLCQPSLWASGALVPRPGSQPLQAKEGARMRPEVQVDPSCFRNARFSTKATRHPVVQIKFLLGRWSSPGLRPSTQLPDGPDRGHQPGVPKGLCLNENAHSSPVRGRAVQCGLQGSGWALERVRGAGCCIRGQACPTGNLSPPTLLNHRKLPLPPSSLL